VQGPPVAYSTDSENNGSPPPFPPHAPIGHPTSAPASLNGDDDRMSAASDNSTSASNGGDNDAGLGGRLSRLSLHADNLGKYGFLTTLSICKLTFRHSWFCYAHCEFNAIEDPRRVPAVLSSCDTAPKTNA
jgi:hypothetical protein